MLMNGVRKTKFEKFGRDNMSPLNRTIVAKLKQMYETLDNIQELWQVQGSQELMDELGEVMGHIDNAIDIIKEKEKLENLKEG